MASPTTRVDNAADGLLGPDPGAHPRHRVYLGVLAAGLAVCAIYVSLPATIGEVFFQIAYWTSIAVAWRGVRRHTTSTVPWASILLGFGLFAIGDLVFAIYDLIAHDSPFPSLADVFYLGGYVPLIVGLVMLVRRTSHGIGGIALIDAGIMLMPAVVAAWLYLVAPLAGATSVGLIERLVSIAYPTADLLCLAVMVRLVIGLNFNSDRRQPALTLLLVALLVTLIADIVFVSVELTDGDYSLGSWFNSLYLLPPIALAGVAATPSIGRVDEPSDRQPLALSRRRLLLLAVAALVTPGVLLVRWLLGDSLPIPLVVAGTGVSFLLVITRMAGLVAELERSQESLRFDATHDLLTRLPNRQLFNAQLERVLSSNRAGALLFIDLDRFKAINDTLGHSAGDDVLIEVAARLRASVRAEDHVGRMSGDEFVVLIDSGDDHVVQSIADRLVDQLVVERPSPAGVLRITAST